MKFKACMSVLMVSASTVFAQDNNHVDFISNAVKQKTVVDGTLLYNGPRGGIDTETVLVRNNIRYTIWLLTNGELRFYLRPDGSYSPEDISVITYSQNNGKCIRVLQSENDGNAKYYPSNSPEEKYSTMNNEKAIDFCNTHLSSVYIAYQ